VPTPNSPKPRPSLGRLGQLEIELHVSGASRTLCLSGELDMASAPDLHAALGDILPGAREIVLDIEELTFIDSSGLHCMLVCQASCQQAGTALRMTPGKEQPRRLFEISGLLDRLPLTEDSTVCG
jgi:anti-sigma B factor antagonist